jgi:hypothetical protein
MDAQSPAHADAAWRWNGVLRSGETIEIRLVRGSLRAETDSGTETVVALVRRGEHSEPASTRLTVDTSSKRVRIEDRYPAVNAINLGHECVSPTDARGDFWHSDVRFDAVVRVPAGVRLIVHLMDGDVDVRSLTGPRDVRTNQGAVRGEAHVPYLSTTLTP